MYMIMDVCLDHYYCDCGIRGYRKCHYCRKTNGTYREHFVCMNCRIGFKNLHTYKLKVDVQGAQLFEVSRRRCIKKHIKNVECTNCGHTVGEPIVNKDKDKKCPTCGNTAEMVSSDFRVPKKSDKKAWKKLDISKFQKRYSCGGAYFVEKPTLDEKRNKKPWSTEKWTEHRRENVKPFENKINVPPKLIISSCSINDLITQDDGGNTPLHEAIKDLANDTIEQIIKRLTNKQLIIENEDGNTPLHEAIQYGCEFAIDHLLKRLSYEQLAIANKDGNMPLHEALQYGCDFAIDQLIYKLNDEQLIIPNNDGCTLLHYACIFGSCEDVERLLNRLDISQYTIQNKQGETPLHCACRFNRYEIVEFLIEQLEPKDKFIKNNNGDMPENLTCDKKIKTLFNPMVKSAIEC